MELLSGTMLACRLAEGALPWPEAVKVCATIADVLAIAHRRGVVHRDLTPTNIMMTETGPKIIDFGEATTVQAVSALALDQPLPSRRVSSAPAPADDVYALGVLLYQTLTGRSPYPTASADGQMHAARMRHLAPTPVLPVPGPRVGQLALDLQQAGEQGRVAQTDAEGQVRAELDGPAYGGPADLPDPHREQVEGADRGQ